MGLRLYGIPAGENLGTVQLAIGASNASTTVTAHQQPATVTGLPRINSGQHDGDTLTLDAGGLTLTSYQWQSKAMMGDWTNIAGAASNTYDTTGQGHGMQWIRCVTPEGTTPPIHIYEQMMMASHTADDKAVLALMPHHEATHIAVASGNWNNTGTWLNGRIPRFGGRVLIQHGVTVTYDHAGFERLDWLRIDGTLQWALDQSTKILCETIEVTHGGKLHCGTPGNRLPPEHTAEFMLSNRRYRTSAAEPTDLGGGILANDPTLVSRGILSQAERVMWGAAKTHWIDTRCKFELQTALTGATETSVVLTEAIPTTLDPLGGAFQVVVTDPNDANHLEYIDVTYTSYTGSTLTIVSQDFSTLNAPAGSTVYISFSPMAGDTKVTLKEAPVGWRVNDELLFGGTRVAINLSDSESEVVRITEINGDVVTFAPALQFNHDHQNPAVKRADLCLPVGNLSRNIKIYTEDGAAIPPHRRGHTMDMHMHCHQDLWEVEHYDLGRTIKNPNGPYAGKIIDGQFKRPNGVSEQFDTSPVTTDINLQSRYPMHGHLVGHLKTKKDTINGCVVRNTPGWGIAHHEGDQLVNENIVYEFAGAGIAAEVGSEIGEWINNLAVKSLNRVQNNPKVLQNVAGKEGDDMRWGYGMAFAGRAIRSTGNVAMDCSSGHVYMHRTLSNITITPIKPLPREALDFGDLEGVRGAGTTTMSAYNYPIIHNNDARAIAPLWAGLYVSKADPIQWHGITINIKNTQVWAAGSKGIDIEYIAQYAVTNADCVGAPGAKPHGIGVLMSANTQQMSTVNARVEGFGKGVESLGNIAGSVTRGSYNVSADPLSVIAGLKAINCTTNISDSVNGSVHPALLVHAVTPARVEPSHTLPFKIGRWAGGGGALLDLVTGTLSDSLNSAGQLPKPVDPAGVPVSDGTPVDGARMTALLDNLGGYEMVNGVPYAVIYLYFSDRLTGVPIASKHGIQLSVSLTGRDIIKTWMPAPNVITIPTVQFNVPKNGSQTIDILALASNTAGRPLSVVTNMHNRSRFTHWNPDHGRLEWDGASSVTYAPDANYTGKDFGWMFIEDDIGNVKRVDLEITVT